MKQLIRLLIVGLVAAIVATVIVQRDRLRQMDREQLMTQFRGVIQSRFSREQADEGLDGATGPLEVAEAADEANTAEAIAESVEESADATTGGAD